MATLHELITGLRYEVLKGSTSCALAGITADSRKVQPGWAFVAIPGVKVDGHTFIAQAVARGASLLVVDRPLDLTTTTLACCLRVPDSRHALAHMAAAFFGHPSQQLPLIRGTVTSRCADHERPADQTTPAAEDIQHLLRQMVDAGVSDCAMEVSSHALAQ